MLPPAPAPHPWLAVLEDLARFLELAGLIILGFILAFIGLAPSHVADDGGWSGAHDTLPALAFSAATAGAHTDTPNTASAARRLLRAGLHAVDDHANSAIGSSNGTWGGGGAPGGWWSTTIRSTAALVFWSIFGEFDLEKTEDRAPFGAPLLFIYGVVVSIVLVNLLVAMFADSYARIKARSETEYA